MSIVRGGELADAHDHRRKRNGDRVVDVRGNLRAPVPEVDADRPHPIQAAPCLAKARGDVASERDVGTLELDVERDQRRTGGDESRAGGGVELARAEGQPQLPPIDSTPELHEPAGAKEGPLAVALVRR